VEGLFLGFSIPESILSFAVSSTNPTTGSSRLSPTPWSTVQVFRCSSQSRCFTWNIGTA